MAEPLDPAALLAAFIGRVSPDDPDPDADPVALLSVRTVISCSHGTRT